MCINDHWQAVSMIRFVVACYVWFGFGILLETEKVILLPQYRITS
jgi:hypothetical protein